MLLDRAFLVGVALTILAFVAPLKWPDMSPLLLDAALGFGCLLLGVSLGSWLVGRRTTGRQFGDLLPFIERLCADEHELGLRGRFAFSPDNAENRVTPLSREDRTRYQAALRGLEGACAPLGLSISVAHIRRGIDAFSPELANVDVSQAYGTLNVISQTLKSELADKYRLAPAA